MSPISLRGQPASPGRATGPVVRIGRVPQQPPPPWPATDARDAEAERIFPATRAVAARLQARADSATGDARAVLEATVAMASDPALRQNAEKLVREAGRTAPRAVWEAANEFAETLAALEGPLGERATDIRDVRDRIVAELRGLPAPDVAGPTGPAVLVAADLSPADTAVLRPGAVLALVTEQGGPTSHTAILARSLGIPAVVGCGDAGQLAEGAFVEVDGCTGTVTEADATEATAVAVEKPSADWDGTGRTSDGHRVPLLANVGDAPSAAAAARRQAQGVGLFRTEFAFPSASAEPSQADQRESYAAVLDAFPGRPVTARTLDAGADKPLPFLTFDAEPNPALGVRGLRTAHAHPTGADVLDRQLAALAAASTQRDAELAVMAPMVATAEEARYFVTRCREHGIARVGVMIEIPAAAVSAREIMAEVDFVSVGTNDLAQYLFAADRQSGPVAPLNDPWQPSLLRMIRMLGDASAETGVPVGVCGEAAADPRLAPVLVGLGASSLSMAPGALAAVGGSLAGVTLGTCRAMGEAACAAHGPEAARQAVAAVAARTAGVGPGPSSSGVPTAARQNQATREAAATAPPSHPHIA